MKKIGLLGCGAIGMQIAQAIDSGTIPAKLVSVYDQDEKRASALIAKLSDKPRMAQNAHMLSSEDVDLVVEDHHVSPRYEAPCIQIRFCRPSSLKSSGPMI